METKLGYSKLGEAHRARLIGQRSALQATVRQAGKAAEEVVNDTTTVVVPKATQKQDQPSKVECSNGPNGGQCRPVN